MRLTSPYSLFSRSLEMMALENPLRPLIHDPYRVLEEMGVRAGATLLDIGCGSGYIAIPAAEVVGQAGHIYALDNDGGKLSRLKRKAERRGLKNLTTILTDAWRINQLNPGTIDVALMFFSLHHFEKKRESLRMAWEKLKSGARLFIFEPIKIRMAGHGTDAGEVLRASAEEGFIHISLRTGLLTYRLELLKP